MLSNVRRLSALPIVHLFIIAAVCVIVYSNSFKAPFMFDDYTNIIEKSVVRDIGQYKDNFLLVTPSTNRRFVAILTFALNYRLHGMNVMGYHIFNLIVHVLNALLVYQLIRLIFRTPAGSNPALGNNVMALFTALLFAVHPVQTSAVTYIVQRYTSLATLFCLVTLTAYAGSRLTASTALRYTLYAISIFSVILAMRTKEIAFTLPVIAVMFEFMFFEGKIKRRILYLIPLILTMSIIPISILAANSPSAPSAINSTPSVINTVVNNSLTSGIASSSAAVTDIPRTEYLFTQFRVIVTYLRLLFVPVGLNLDYDYHVLRSFFNPEVVLSFLVLALLFASVVYMLYRFNQTGVPYRFLSRLYSFGILWFFIALSVESSVMPIKDVINEYRLYYPSAGFFIAVMSAVAWTVEKWERQAKTYVFSALPVILVLFSVMTLLRNDVWADRVRLWEDTVRKSPGKARPHYNLGYDYLRQGRVADASREFQTAIILKPDFADAYNNLGDIYASQGRMDEALNAFKKAVQYKPDFAVAYNNLGTIYDERGQIEDAAAHYRTAVKLQPDYIDAHLNLGNLMIKANQLNDAVMEFQSVLKYAPYNDEASEKLRALRGTRK
ncbi:MAG: tetratricopeptide repeat protein [Nitrospirota bacterium]